MYVQRVKSTLGREILKWRFHSENAQNVSLYNTLE